MEVLVAVSIVAALIGMMFVFLSNVLASRAKVLEHSDRQRAATTLIEHIEADLMTCIVGDGEYGPGVQGDGAQLAILTQSVSPLLHSAPADERMPHRDMQHTEYRFDPARRIVEGRRGPAVRKTSDDSSIPAAPASAKEGGERVPRGGFSSLGSEIPRVRFRYHNGMQWRESFDSLAAGHLPRAVEIAIWFTSPLDESIKAANAASASLAEIGGAHDARPGAAFDEEAWAIASDIDAVDDHRPDRVRVIVIPDSLAEDDSATSTAIGGSEP
jgi:hypothetical protein